MGRVTEIEIKPIKPFRGHIGFASCVLDNEFYLSSIAIHTRPNGGIRLVYPTIKGLHVIHPISKPTGQLLEQEIGGEYMRLFS